MSAEISCPKCGHPNPLGSANCQNCRINLKYAFEHPDIWAKVEAAEREQKEAWEKYQELSRNMIVTTTHTIQNATISKYVGVVSSVVVLGTGFWSDLSADVADFMGARSGAMQEKLATANQAAIKELREQAVKIGADAVIGVDLDYMITNRNMFVVTANGTAVKLVNA